ncbi:MAG TPA: hypothetical protein VEV65_12990 [Kineosporiaceae bacterium]|nr:hypothetical protein [Kineosporiaceae bacterium]
MTLVGGGEDDVGGGGAELVGAGAGVDLVGAGAELVGALDLELVAGAADRVAVVEVGAGAEVAAGSEVAARSEPAVTAGAMVRRARREAVVVGSDGVPEAPAGP